MSIAPADGRKAPPVHSLALTDLHLVETSAGLFSPPVCLTIELEIIDWILPGKLRLGADPTFSISLRCIRPAWFYSERQHPASIHWRTRISHLQLRDEHPTPLHCSICFTSYSLSLYHGLPQSSPKDLCDSPTVLDSTFLALAAQLNERAAGRKPFILARLGISFAQIPTAAIRSPFIWPTISIPITLGTSKQRIKQ